MPAGEDEWHFSFHGRKRTGERLAYAVRVNALPQNMKKSGSLTSLKPPSHDRNQTLRSMPRKAGTTHEKNLEPPAVEP